jgi:hypothetical protein
MTTDYTQTCLTFSNIITGYARLQCNVTNMVKKLASSSSSANPGEFLMVQFAMANVAQMGESISNLISQVNTVCSHAIQNQKTQ